MLTHALGRALGAALRSEPAPCPINVGPTWIVADLETARAVNALEPDMAQLKLLCRERDATGVSVFGRSNDPEIAFEVRSFAPAQGIPEDPVCGSGNAAIAAFLHANDQLPRSGGGYIVAQGSRVGRDGRVHVRIADDGAIEIGGEAVTCVDGTIRL
jgi:PhzF family phenazine biosynthesis protein